VLKLMGEPDPQAELADIRSRAESRSTLGARAGLPLEVSLSAVSGHLHRRIQPTGGHQRHPLLPEQHLCMAAGFSQISGDQQAIAIGART
jgi:hypothetical protein